MNADGPGAHSRLARRSRWTPCKSFAASWLAGAAGRWTPTSPAPPTRKSLSAYHLLVVDGGRAADGASTFAAAAAAAWRTASRPFSMWPTITAPTPASPATRPAPTPISSVPSPPRSCSPRPLGASAPHQGGPRPPARENRRDPPHQQAPCTRPTSRSTSELELAQPHPVELPAADPAMESRPAAASPCMVPPVRPRRRRLLRRSFRLDPRATSAFTSPTRWCLGVPASLLTIFSEKGGARPKGRSSASSTAW